MHSALAASMDRALERLDSVPPERMALLDEVVAYVNSKASEGEESLLTFICTHNSRRSQMGQLWAAAAAARFGVDGVKTFSGGTEVTAFNARAVAAMERAGFAIDPGTDLRATESGNPHYRVTYSQDSPAIECFSKVYDDPFNPAEGFAALMTCGEADEACPLVFGAAARIALRYVDPKSADGTPQETAAYNERAEQIATEMLYVFSRVG